METNSSISILKNKGFVNLWFNQILVQLSYNALNFGLLIWVYELTKSSSAVAMLLIAVYLPSVIFGLFAGLIVDITDRKKIIMIINFLLILCFLSLIILKTSLLPILAVVFLINSLIQFYISAESSAIPLICTRNQLLSANSIFSITLFGSFLGGFGIAGPLISFFNIDFVFIFGAALLLAAFILSFFFPSIRNTLDPLGVKLKTAFEKRNLSLGKEVGIRELKNTFSLIKGRVAVMVSLFILASVQVVIAVLGALIPSFFEGILNMNAENASHILILPLGFGMVIGGAFLSKYGSLIPKRTIVSTGIITAGLLFFAVGFSEKFYFSDIFGNLNIQATLATGAFILGLSMVSVVVPSQTALQEYSPEKDRGKVYAFLSVLMASMTLIPVTLAGVIADFFGIQIIFSIIGGVVFLIGLLALKPNFYFTKKQLPFKVREFLGLGHWRKNRN